jgi:pimeloyl-ACP methyl ester carboxylesterase
MWFWRTRVGVLVLLGIVAIVALAMWTVLGVHRATDPVRQVQVLPDFESMQIRVTEVEFPSADGMALSGWWMPGNQDMPPILLCHDRHSSKHSMVNLAIALRAEGFSVLMFDFRGHGDSAGDRSSLGVLEKRDVTGALDWLAKRSAGRVGIFGAGMGAHAVVLAAVERPELQVLVLDGLYPDAAYPLAREVYPAMTWVRKGFGFVANGVFFILHGTSPRSQRAADLIGELAGRHLLMLAPASDSALMDEMREMVQRIPEQVDADANLVVVPATFGEGLYGEQQGRYHERVTGFFAARLVQEQVSLAAGW